MLVIVLIAGSKVPKEALKVDQDCISDRIGDGGLTNREHYVSLRLVWNGVKSANHIPMRARGTIQVYVLQNTVLGKRPQERMGISALIRWDRNTIPSKQPIESDKNGLLVEVLVLLAEIDDYTTVVLLLIREISKADAQLQVILARVHRMVNHIMF